MQKLGFLGAGNMGGALIRGLIKFGAIDAHDVYVCGHHPEKLRAFSQELGFHVCETLEEMAKKTDAILFAVKPYHIENVLKESGACLKDKVMLSVISGYDFDRYDNLLDASVRHLYIMPNTPSSVGEGVLMFEEKHNLTDEEFSWVHGMFSKIGSVFTLPSRLMGAGAAVAGCGPAFIAMVLESLADAGVKYGIPRKTAYALCAQTALGTAKMQMETGLHPGEIKDGVCSPLGTTIRGVQALEKAGMRSAFMDAVDAVMQYGK